MFTYRIRWTRPGYTVAFTADVLAESPEIAAAAFRASYPADIVVSIRDNKGRFCKGADAPRRDNKGRFVSYGDAAKISPALAAMTASLTSSRIKSDSDKSRERAREAARMAAREAREKREAAARAKRMARLAWWRDAVVTVATGSALGLAVANAGAIAALAGLL